MSNFSLFTILFIHDLELRKLDIIILLPNQVQSRDEYKKLQNWCNILQAGLGPSSQQFEGVDCEPLNCNLKTDDYALVVGGFDGYALLHEMSSYSPWHDRMESLSPMAFQRTCHSVANLNSEVYVLGGVYGDETYDTGIGSHFTYLFGIGLISNFHI